MTSWKREVDGLFAFGGWSWIVVYVFPCLGNEFRHFSGPLLGSLLLFGLLKGYLWQAFQGCRKRGNLLRDTHHTPILFSDNVSMYYGMYCGACMCSKLRGEGKRGRMMGYPFRQCLDRSSIERDADCMFWCLFDFLANHQSYDAELYCLFAFAHSPS
jgi:hypothetical protein